MEEMMIEQHQWRTMRAEVQLLVNKYSLSSMVDVADTM